MRLAYKEDDTHVKIDLQANDSSVVISQSLYEEIEKIIITSSSSLLIHL